MHSFCSNLFFPSQVDVLISEPLGIALVNERMLESYVAARDHLLKPGGKMFPDHSVLYAAPFSDEALYSEQLQKSAFWGQVQKKQNSSHCFPCYLFICHTPIFSHIHQIRTTGLDLS